MPAKLKPICPVKKRNALVTENIRLVHWCVSRLHRLAAHLDRDDLEQVGALALIRAAELFDPAYGVTFSSYAVSAIRRRIGQTIDRTRVVGTALPDGEIPDRRSIDPAEAAAQRDLVGLALAAARPRERLAMRLVFLEGKSQCAAGRTLGISTTRMQQVLQRGLDRARKALAPQTAPQARQDGSAGDLTRTPSTGENEAQTQRQAAS